MRSNVAPMLLEQRDLRSGAEKRVRAKCLYVVTRTNEGENGETCVKNWKKRRTMRDRIPLVSDVPIARNKVITSAQSLP
jgi:hypothetical protein